MPASYAQQQPIMGRPLYSPPMNFRNRNTNSHYPATSEGLPPPPYDISLPPFPTSMYAGGGQEQQQSSNLRQLGSESPQRAPLHTPDTYGGRPPPTPTYYAPSSMPQQSSFPAYTQQASDNPFAPSQRISPVSAQPHSSMAAPQGYYSRPSYSGYALPAMAGPIMSNLHSPENQMAVVGGMNMQYPPYQMGGPMYGHHHGQQQQQNDRPFKCDQCPQSYNRNHDLKRHRQIHLAVKPFPCGYCERSFSRKDALKVRSRETHE
jgi:hypothetical protein